MQASPRRHAHYYRSMARTLAPGSAALSTHPSSTYVREDEVLPPPNRWIAQVFAPQHRADTVNALGAWPTTKASSERVDVWRTPKRLPRHQRAIEGGVDPAALAPTAVSGSRRTGIG